jgi:hypothetical protein
MTLQAAPAADRVAGRWRNGGGVTREVARADSGRPGLEFDWRISIADVEADGPFSTFPGCRRIITVIRGAGMELTVDGRPVMVAPYRPYAFDGSARTECRLVDGPVMDVNVIAAGGRPAEVEILRPAGSVDVPGTAVVLALAGQASVAATGDRVTLGPLDAAIARDETSLRLDGDPEAMVAVVRLAGE